MQISAHLAFSSSAQKDDSQWGPSPDCRAGGCGNTSNPSCSTVSRVRRAVCSRALSCNRITPCVSNPLCFVHIAVLSRFSRLQYDDVFTVLPCSWNSTQQYSSCPRTWSESAIVCVSIALKPALSPVIVMNPGLITRYNPVQHRLSFCLVAL